MESESLLRRLYKLLRENLVAVILGCSGLLFLGYGLTTFSDTTNTSENIIIEHDSEPDESVDMIMVDVSGAVERPGVYEFTSESRIKDALSKAGGMREDADHLYVSKTLNLATLLTDGMKVYIPTVSEAQEDSVLADDTGLISINNSSSTRLEELPGVGPVTAKKIIDNRPYGSVEELLTKKSVGNAVFEKIKDQISL